MTKEKEAMCYLHNPEDDDCYNAKEIEAYNLAIKALEHLEKNVIEAAPCDDTISRQAALDALYSVDEYNVQSIKAIKNLQPVMPQPKTGHWIFCKGIKGKDNVEKCSCCQSHWKEAVIYRNDTKEFLMLRLKYCPSCGTKMEKK